MSNLVPLNEMERMASAVAASGLFGVKKPEEALSLMLIAQAEGTHPAIAVRDYHIIQGKPALKADAMLARFQQNGGKVQWHSLTDDSVSATFSHPSGGSVKIEWTMEMAKRAGFAGKDNWRKFPRQMLRARVVSEGIRTVYPGVVVGAYTPEEVQDFDAPKDMGPVEVVQETTPFTRDNKILQRDFLYGLRLQDTLEEVDSYVKAWQNELGAAPPQIYSVLFDQVEIRKKQIEDKLETFPVKFSFVDVPEAVAFTKMMKERISGAADAFELNALMEENDYKWRALDETLKANKYISPKGEKPQEWIMNLYKERMNTFTLAAE